MSDMEAGKEQRPTGSRGSPKACEALGVQAAMQRGTGGVAAEEEGQEAADILGRSAEAEAAEAKTQTSCLVDPQRSQEGRQQHRRAPEKGGNLRGQSQGLL